MKKEIPDAAICILFFEKIGQTIECINSFLPSGVPIFILNNGSSQESRVILETFCQGLNQVSIFNSDINFGVSGGRNFLITHTDKKWLFFVDNDIVINSQNWIDIFNKNIVLFPDADAFVPRLYNRHEHLYSDYSWCFRIEGNKVFTDGEMQNACINWFPGGAAIVNRGVFQKLGLYDEKMFVGGEDFEFSIRAIKLHTNIHAYLLNTIELIHDHRIAITEIDKKAISVRYDVSHQETSFNRISEKHNVIFESSWRKWTKRQMKILSGNKSPLSTIDWIGMIPRPIKKVIKKYLYSRVRPLSCSLYMTYSCNFHCTFCRRNVTSFEHRKNMELSVVQKIVQQYPTIRYFTLAGFGEPTLCPDFPKIVDYLKGKHKFVGIITNGSNIEPFMTLQMPPNSISISLYGYNSATYCNTTGMDHFEQVISNYQILKSKFYNVGFSVVITKKNYRNLEKILELCDRIKPDFLDLANCLPYVLHNAGTCGDTITCEDTEIIDFIDKVCTGRDYIRQKMVYINLKVPKHTCRTHNYIINLDGEGNIGGCQRQIPPDPQFGNIFLDTNAYKSLKMREIREKINKNEYPFEECRYCFGNYE